MDRVIMLNEQCSIVVYQDFRDKSKWCAGFRDTRFDEDHPEHRFHRNFQAVGQSESIALGKLIEQLIRSRDYDEQINNYHELAIDAFIVGNWQTIDTAPADKLVCLHGAETRLSDAHSNVKLGIWIDEDGTPVDKPEYWMARPDNLNEPDIYNQSIKNTLMDRVIMLNEHCSIVVYQDFMDKSKWRACFRDTRFDEDRPEHRFHRNFQAVGQSESIALGKLIEQLIKSRDYDEQINNYHELAIDAFIAGNWQTIDTSPADKLVCLHGAETRLSDAHSNVKLGIWIDEDGTPVDKPEYWMARPDNLNEPELVSEPECDEGDSSQMMP